jgi:adenine-specific DNA-methyltransferase
MSAASLTMGNRSLGHVPTPPAIVRAMVALTAPLPAARCRVLEPACADAPFLRAFRAAYGAGHALVGVELRPPATCPPDARIHEADFLLWRTDERFEVVLGNPPYGIVGDAAHYPIHALRERKADYKRVCQTWRGKYNLYGAFVERAARLLTPSGRLVFITPATWLVLDDFRLLRRFLASRGRLEVFAVGRVFPKVNVSAVILRFTAGGRGLALYDWRGCVGAPRLCLEQPCYAGDLIRFETAETQAWEQSGAPLGEAFDIRFAARSTEFRRSGLTRPAPAAGDVPILTGRNLAASAINYATCYSGLWMRREDAPHLRAFYAEPHLVVGHTKGARLICAVDWQCYPWREEYHLAPKAGSRADWARLEAYLNSEPVQRHLQTLYCDLTPHLTRTMLRACR